MQKIYISHKYGADEKNKERVEKIVKTIVKQYPDVCPVSPIHTFGFFYKDVPYMDGLYMCLVLLRFCDEIWICSEKSRGVRHEELFAELNHIPIRYFDFDGEKLTEVENESC